MTPHTCYRHLSTLDVDLMVIRVRYSDAKRVKLRGVLYNRRNGDMYERRTYTIQRRDLWKWRAVACG